MQALLDDPFEVGRSQIAKGETYYLTLKEYENARSAFEQGIENIKDQQESRSFGEDLSADGTERKR